MNRLSKETSPYLLQHAHNPVDWFAWGQEALQKAQEENKPILVSIGYSACHWCHVMERESFENEQIAAIMNAHFICIKIDREERPDIDAIYMDACHAMGLRGGWPLNVFLMPDAKPFYGGTYFPPKNWANLLMSIDEAFKNNRAALQDSANGFAESLQMKDSEKYNFESSVASHQLSVNDIRAMFETLYQNFDFEKGGTNRSPKFPMPSSWKFLLRYYAISSDERALKHLKLTLDRMALGGIYDQIGGGWARYSTDSDWFCPHFEKMLYDNAQLLSLYSEMYQLTKDSLYKEKVYQTITWLEHEMLDKSGGFYSALDADSEGVEGKFYVWKKYEIEEVLGENAEGFCKIYTITEAGNWEHGNNILHQESRVKSGDAGLDNKNSIIPSFPHSLIEKLRMAREKRVRPSIDNKVLCSWNGLTIKGLADAFRVFGEEKFKDLAIKNAEFIFEKMTISVETEDGRIGRGLWHSCSPSADEPPKIIGFLEDYAAVIEGYISLYQATFNEKWLHEAQQLANYAIANFYDADEGFFYFTDIAGETLIARKKELFDNVIPSSNSIMAENLFWLGILTENADYQEVSNKMFAQMQGMISTQTEWLSNWACLAACHAKPIAEVAVVGKNVQEIRAKLEEDFNPNRIIVGTETTSNLPIFQNRSAIDAKTTIYVCFDKTCQLPTHDVELAKEFISKG